MQYTFLNTDVLLSKICYLISCSFLSHAKTLVCVIKTLILLPDHCRSVVNSKQATGSPFPQLALHARNRILKLLCWHLVLPAMSPRVSFGVGSCDKEKLHLQKVDRVYGFSEILPRQARY